jgi:hypothetical protein
MITGIGRELTQLSERRHSVHLSGHHEVEHCDVGLALLYPGESFDPIRSFGYLIALAGEQRADHPPDIRLVVGDENDGHLRGAILRSCARRSELARFSRASPFGEELGGESLSLRDSLHFDRDCLEGLLNPLEPSGNLRRYAWLPGF